MQLRDLYPEIQRRGAELVAIGNGSPADMAAFQADFGLPFPVFTDPQRKSYRAARWRSGLLASLNPRLLRNGLRAWRQGFRQIRQQGHAFQQGGALVIDRGGRILLRFEAATGGDHVRPEALLAALDKTEAVPQPDPQQTPARVTTGPVDR